MMKKELLFAFGAFFLMSLHAIAGNSLTDPPQTETMTIKTYKKDVTGDDKRDIIKLNAIPFEPDALFLKQIWATITTSEGSKLRIDYEGGYEPEITFADLNHDGVKDLLYRAATGGSGGLYDNALHTAKGGKVQELDLPSGITIDAHFENQYKGVISFPDTQQSYTVDLSDRKDDYERLGIFTKGILNEPTELMVAPIAFFEPTKIRGKKGKGLKGYQQISGAYRADGVGTATSYWYYEDGKWTLMKIVWKTDR